MSKRVKQVMAIVAIVILVGIYGATLVLALVGNENSHGWFMACIYATVVVPIMMYIFSWLYKLVKKSAEESRSGNYIKDDTDEQGK